VAQNACFCQKHIFWQGASGSKLFVMAGTYRGRRKPTARRSIMSTATARQTNSVNGVDLDVLMETVGAIQSDRELGMARFRASNTWMDGNRNRSEVTGFYGARQEIAHAQAFTMDADEPPILAGQDSAPNPVEHLLHALASCLTTSMVAHAAVRGIAIEALESELEGDIDLNGFLGLDANAPKGFTEIRAKFRVQADPEDVDRIKALAEFSPVFNTITNGANVEVSVDLK
jgi:uncharacterized OsmC-like protein